MSREESAEVPEPAELPEIASTVIEMEQAFGAGVYPRVQLMDEEEKEALDDVTPDQASSPSRYVRRREVGRGGMGAVFEVFDRDLRRRLAMKVILANRLGADPEGLLRTQAVGRFLEEAQVTGQLDHPGIVPVHELGVDSQGRAYFTMQLVRGRDFKSTLRMVQRGEDGWSVTRALGVLLKVCEAMAYAHHKGVVHRDLKPANVMVGKFGEVYVMDWGLARVAGHGGARDIRPEPAPNSLSEVMTDRRDARESGEDSPLVTMDGAVLGTPAYMSPEQARGESELVDERSDVYSVGAMLYQLLTRRVPYVPEGARISPRTLLASVIQGPPEPLRRLAPQTPLELESICEKAMSRGRDERYASMDELGEDLRAFLEGRVVRAHATGAVAELTKWVRRNRPLSAAIAAAIVLLVAGLTSSLWFGSKASRARDLASENARIADAVTGFLNEDLLATVAPGRLGRDATVRQALDAASAALVDRFPGDPLIEARLRLTLGDSYLWLSEFPEALENLRRSVELYAGELGRRHEDTLGALCILGLCLTDAGELDEAVEVNREFYDTSVAELGEHHELSLFAIGNLAIALRKAGRGEEAGPLYERSLELMREMHGEEDPQTLVAINNLSVLRKSQGRFAEAQTLGEEAVRLRRKVLGDDDASTLLSISNLASLYEMLHRFDEAEQLFDEVIAKRRTLHGETHYWTIESMAGRAGVKLARGEFAGAAADFEAVLRLMQGARLPDDHHEVLNTKKRLADALARSGQEARAEELYQEVLDTSTAFGTREHPLASHVLYERGALRLRAGEPERAEPLLRRAVDSARRTLPEAHWLTGLFLDSLGNSLRELDRPEEAEAAGLEAHAILSAVLPADHPRVRQAARSLVTLYEQWGQPSKAAPWRE